MKITSMSQRGALGDEVSSCAVHSARLSADGHIEFEYSWTMESTSGKGPVARLPPAVEIDRNMFRRFLSLERGSDRKILDFVLRYGPLPEQDTLPRSQPIAKWREYSKIANAIFRLGTALQNERLGEDNDYRVIFAFLERDFTFLLSVEPDEAWGPPPDEYRKAIDAARKGLVFDAINKWYDLAPHHSLITVVDAEPVILPCSRGLLGVIIQQIARSIMASQAAICSGCAEPFKPKRKPREGQRRYCQACRQAGIPHVQSVRDYRERIRPKA